MLLHTTNKQSIVERKGISLGIKKRRNKAIIPLVIFIVLMIAVIGATTGCGTGQFNEQGNNGADTTISATQEPQENTVLLSSAEQLLKAHFIDVGQADSILVQAPDNKVMLIDAGNNGDADAVTEYIKAQGINKIDILIGTHPHEDHIGGMDAVINTFDIGSIYMPKAISATKTFEDVLAAVKNKGLKVKTAAAGVRLDIGTETKAELLAPNGDSYEDLNNYSAVVKMTYKDTSFLLTGDAESVSEKEMLSKGFDLKADVLKIGHHGSGSSTSANFLTEVSPKHAVISVGKNNDYGHPHKAVMQRLKNKGIQVYRTDQNGTIVAVSDGKTIKFNVKPGDYSYNSEGAGTVQEESGNKPEQKPSSNTSGVEQPKQNNNKTVYFTPKGKSYHYSKSCRTLARSKTILEGTLEDAVNSGHSDPCDVCTK